jgi:phage baseplate assembly protein W
LPKYRYYAVSQGETLQQIARVALGNAEDWVVLATLNNLRYPYISEDPRDLLGHPQSEGRLALDAIAGSSFAFVEGFDNPPKAGQMLYFVSPTAAGGEAARITSVEVSTGMIQFEPEIKNNWSQGNPVVIYPDPADLKTTVLRPGDLLKLPGESNIQDFTLDRQEWETLLGEDIALDENGQLLFDGGDLATYNGVDNLVQQLQHRLATSYGELPYHKDYGSELPDALGETASPYFILLAKALVRESLLRDPRISDVTNISVQVDGDTVLIDCFVEVSNTKTLLKVTNLVLRVA